MQAKKFFDIILKWAIFIIYYNLISLIIPLSSNNSLVKLETVNIVHYQLIKEFWCNFEIIWFDNVSSGKARSKHVAVTFISKSLVCYICKCHTLQVHAAANKCRIDVTMSLWCVGVQFGKNCIYFYHILYCLTHHHFSMNFYFLVSKQYSVLVSLIGSSRCLIFDVLYVLLRITFKLYILSNNGFYQALFCRYYFKLTNVRNKINVRTISNRSQD